MRLPWSVERSQFRRLVVAKQEVADEGHTFVRGVSASDRVQRGLVEDVAGPQCSPRLETHLEYDGTKFDCPEERTVVHVCSALALRSSVMRRTSTELTDLIGRVRISRVSRITGAGMSQCLQSRGSASHEEAVGNRRGDRSLTSRLLVSGGGSWRSGG